MEAFLAQLAILAVQDAPAFIATMSQFMASLGKTDVTQADWDLLHSAQAAQTSVIDAPIPGEDDAS